MRITTAALLALAANLANAQFAGLPDLSKLPECAVKPATAGIGAAGCELTDLSCICSSPAFIKAVGTQVSIDCSEEDQVAVIEFANSICEPLGKPVPASEVPGQGDEEEEVPEEDAAPVPATEDKAAAAAPAEEPMTPMDGSAAATPPYPIPSGAPLGNATNSSRYDNETVPFTGDAARSGAGRLGGLAALVMGLAGGFAFIV